MSSASTISSTESVGLLSLLPAHFNMKISEDLKEKTMQLHTVDFEKENRVMQINKKKKDSLNTKINYLGLFDLHQFNLQISHNDIRRLVSEFRLIIIFHNKWV